jgi:hypothetical protein
MTFDLWWAKASFDELQGGVAKALILRRVLVRR